MNEAVKLTRLHFTSYPHLSMKLPELAGKKVLITGGGRGIGKQIATSFALAGANHIFLFGRDESSLVTVARQICVAASACKVTTHVADICDASSLAAEFAAITRLHGSIDILVNNAAYYPAHTSALSTDEDTWRAFEVNVRGTLNVTREFAILAHDYDFRVVLTITSASAYAFHAPGAAAYAASKLALMRLMESLAVERNDLRLVSVHPGAVNTGMYHKAGGETVGIPLNDEHLLGQFLVWACGPNASFLHGRTVEANWDIEDLISAKNGVLDKNLLTCGLKGYPIDGKIWKKLSQK